MLFFQNMIQKNRFRHDVFRKRFAKRNHNFYNFSVGTDTTEKVGIDLGSLIKRFQMTGTGQRNIEFERQALMHCIFFLIIVEEIPNGTVKI